MFQTSSISISISIHLIHKGYDSLDMKLVNTE